LEYEFLNGHDNKNILPMKTPPFYLYFSILLHKSKFFYYTSSYLDEGEYFYID